MVGWGGAGGGQMDARPKDEREVKARTWRCARPLRKVTWKREFKLPWRKAGPPNHPDDDVDSDQ